MTDSQIFDLLFAGGKHTLPYLLKFSHPDLDAVCLVNNNEDIEFEGVTYQTATFSYTQPEYDGTGGSLNISSIPNENTLFEFLENADYRYRLDVVGSIELDGTVQKIKRYSHFYGSFGVDENGQIEFQLSNDDRLDMLFTPYKYDTDNNRGAA